MPNEVLTPLKAALPKVADAKVQALLSSPETMWYDDESMVFLYQDSIEVVVGGRANCVGRDVGERNSNNPAISKLKNYFGPDYKFRFPFRTAAGTDNVENVKVINFWAPPKVGGETLPVRYWRPTSRGRWYWTFPLDTVIGEVLFEKGADGKWYCFEIRTRTRYARGWIPNLYRPFLKATHLAQAVMERRPNWREVPELQAYIDHLLDRSTLTPHRLESPAFGKVFKPVDGSLDRVPGLSDTQLIVELLTQTPFVSAEGAIWKENGHLETYAPSSQSHFNIVPKGYEMGMIPVNEVSCNRCHSETGHNLGKFEFDIILYGEVWGEEQIFTWHLFDPKSKIFGTWDDADISRRINPVLARAKLVREGKPRSSESHYAPLPSVFQPDFYTQMKARHAY